MKYSQLENIGHELMDLVGPRLVGTPQMLNAHNWAIEKYKSGALMQKRKMGRMARLGTRYYAHRYDRATSSIT